VLSRRSVEGPGVPGAGGVASPNCMGAVGSFQSASYNCRHVDHRLPRRREASHALSAVAAPPDARLTASRSGMLLDLMLGDMGAGGLEDNPLTYGHGVVGEPFVVAAQQSDIDRGGDGVRPLAVHQDAEQKSM
jgi:hypothetical protein